jgi:hypothetical protein
VTLIEWLTYAVIGGAASSVLSSSVQCELWFYARGVGIGALYAIRRGRP